MGKSLRFLGAILMGATLASPAFAVPITPANLRPVVVNPAFPGETPLQTMVDTILGPGLDVATDQSDTAKWSVATLPPSTIPTLAFEQTSGAGSQVFGIWFGTDTNSVLGIDLLLGPAAPGATASIAWSGPGYTTLQVGSSNIFDCTLLGGTAVNCGAFTNALITPFSFGFYMRTGGGATYYSADLLNGDVARMVAYDKGTNWAIAFEDGGDFDYQDMVVKVESISAVPEPGTLLLIGSGLTALALRRRRRS